MLASVPGPDSVCVCVCLFPVALATSANNQYVLQSLRFLTWGLVSVGLGGDVVLHQPLLGSCHLLHLADLGHAKFGVVVEKHAPLQDGELVFGPVPELPQVLVVQGVKGVIPRKKNEDCMNIFFMIHRGRFLSDMSRKVFQYSHSTICIMCLSSAISTVSVAHCATTVFHPRLNEASYMIWESLTKNSYHSKTIWKGQSFRF